MSKNSEPKVDIEITLTLRGVETNREDVINNLNFYLKCADASVVDSLKIKDS